MESPPILNAMKLRTKKKAEHMGDVGPRRTNQRSPKSTNPEEINVFGFHCGRVFSFSSSSLSRLFNQLKLR